MNSTAQRVRRVSSNQEGLDVDPIGTSLRVSEDGPVAAPGSDRAQSFRLSAFADEIAIDPVEQIEVLKQLGIPRLELRSAWQKNVLSLDDGEIEQLKDIYREHAMSVACIATRIGKESIEKPAEAAERDLSRALEVASAFETRYLRVFSYYVRERSTPDPVKAFEEAVRRLTRWSVAAADHDSILLIEPEPGMVAGRFAQTLELLRRIDSPNVALVWDPANWVQMPGIERPVDEGFAELGPFIQCVHIKDFSRASGLNCVAGAGDGQVAELLVALRRNGFDGWLSLEPGLTRERGNESREAMASAARALRSVIDTLGFAVADG